MYTYPYYIIIEKTEHNKLYVAWERKKNLMKNETPYPFVWHYSPDTESKENK